MKHLISRCILVVARIAMVVSLVFLVMVFVNNDGAFFVPFGSCAVGGLLLSGFSRVVEAACLYIDKDNQ